MGKQVMKIMRGLPASGKTTVAIELADQYGYVRVSRDDYRQMLFNKPAPLTWEQEKVVTIAHDAANHALLKAGKSVVVDNMHLRPKYILQMVDIAKAYGAHVDVVEMDIDLDASIERDRRRGRQVGEDVIRDMYARFTPKGKYISWPRNPDEVKVDLYKPPQGAQKAIMVDIDGTIARMTDRGPYEWERVGEDEPVKNVIEAVETFEDAGYNIIFCTGRSEECRLETRAWLREHLPEIHMYPMHMRPKGDNRKDSVVKLEMFDKYIRDEYDVRFVLDDRQQVVDMWRSIGLTCFQVAEGDF